MSKRVITINRMLGSNGRLIGKALAEELGFAFYDKELIDIAAQKENIPFDLLAKVDEKRGSQWRFPIDHELQMDSDFHFIPMNDVLFDLQRKIILDAAEKEDCVIVGRCANHILDNRCLSVFIHAPLSIVYRLSSSVRDGKKKVHRSWLRKWIKNGVLIMSTLQIRNGKIFPSIIWHLTAVNLSRIKLYR